MCRLLHVGADYGMIVLEDALIFILGEPTSSWARKANRSCEARFRPGNGMWH
jgi:hypothetical protein